MPLASSLLITLLTVRARCQILMARRALRVPRLAAPRGARRNSRCPGALGQATTLPPSSPLSWHCSGRPRRSHRSLESVPRRCLWGGRPLFPTATLRARSAFFCKARAKGQAVTAHKRYFWAAGHFSAATLLGMLRGLARSEQHAPCVRGRGGCLQALLQLSCTAPGSYADAPPFACAEEGVVTRRA